MNHLTFEKFFAQFFQRAGDVAEIVTKLHKTGGVVDALFSSWLPRSIESTFTTVRHRIVRSNGCLSTRTAITMVFKLAQAAEKNWRRLDGHSQLPKLITGVKFIDSIQAVSQQPRAA